MTAELATVDGLTRSEAHDAYMKALAELVTYTIQTTPWSVVPAWEAYQWHIGVVRPDVFRAVAKVQAMNHCALNLPMVRTIEIVSH